MVITIAGLVSLIVTLLVFAAIVSLLFYLIRIVPIEEPYRNWINIVLQVLVVLVLIGMLLSFAGFPILRIR